MIAAAALLVAALAAACDLRWRRIPNWVTAPALVAGLGLSYLAHREASACAAASAGLLVGVGLWRLGAWGGGDAKLVAAFGALLGWRLWLWSLEFALLAAGLIAVTQLARRRRLAGLNAVMAALVQHWRRHGPRAHPDYHCAAPAAVTAPFAVPMALGVICALWLR